ncbi:MAG: hypothetical protein ACOY90_05070 [Candidatus Zhuqueibacterota bacterium]
MLKHVLTVTLLMVCSIISIGLSAPNPIDPPEAMQPQARSETPLTKQIALFVDYGYFKPSLSQLNDGIAQLDAKLISSDFQNLSGGYGEIGGSSYINFGLNYYLKPNLKLSFTVGHFNADASTRYFASIQDKEPVWPDRDIDITHSLDYSQEIRMNPALLSVQYTLPFIPMSDKLDLYVGGGLGFYFSSIVSNVHWQYESIYSNGKGVYADSVTVNTSDLFANVRTNANPLGYHLILGSNFHMGLLTFNVEVAYNYAKANIDDGDWQFFTQKHSVNEFVSEGAFDELKIGELDLGGFMVKGGIGLTF